MRCGASARLAGARRLFTTEAWADGELGLLSMLSQIKRLSLKARWPACGRFFRPESLASELLPRTAIRLSLNERWHACGRLLRRESPASGLLPRTAIRRSLKARWHHGVRPGAEFSCHGAGPVRGLATPFTMRFKNTLLLLGFRPGMVLLTVLCAAAQAADWPQWRGPGRTGISAEKGWLDQWPAAGPAIAWRAAVGLGASSFVVGDGRVFTMGHADG